MDGNLKAQAETNPSLPKLFLVIEFCHSNSMKPGHLVRSGDWDLGPPKAELTGATKQGLLGGTAALTMLSFPCFLEGTEAQGGHTCSLGPTAHSPGVQGVYLVRVGGVN